MSFRKKELRDTVLPDFRFTFLGFEGDKARIGIGIREVPQWVENVMVVQTLAHLSLWSLFFFLNFYGRNQPIIAQNLGKVNRGDEISKFMPSHGKKNYAFGEALERGGELLIPKGVNYLWVQVPGAYTRSGSDYVQAFVDYLDINNGMKIDFGATIPSNTVTASNGVWTFKHFVPFAKITIGDGIDIEPYDLGEICFIETPVRSTQGILDFSKISSYYG